MKQIVRTRIAPSPTGEDLHIGSVYMALINYIFAQKNHGNFIIRIEDTDRERYIKGAEARMITSLKWMGIPYDESPDIGGNYGPYRQSERLQIYKKYAETLIKKNAAYYCFCTPERLSVMRKEQQQKGQPPMYDGHCKNLSPEEKLTRIEKEKYVIRLHVPDIGKTAFNDIIHGRVVFENRLIDDQILLKSDGFPTYHLAVVVDDHLMEISHIIRGEEWISSTPKHIILYQSFGWQIPEYAHLPLLRNPDRSKLSKRKNPVWASWYKKEGFLPEAIINYIGTLTWGNKSGKEIFTLKQMIQQFSLEKIKTTAPVFDLTKLTWMNGEYIRKTQNSELRSLIYAFCNKKYPEDLISKIIPLVKERIKKLTEFEFYIKPFLNFSKQDLFDEQKKWIEELVPLLNTCENWSADNLHNIINHRIERNKSPLKEVLMTIRIGITGEKIGLPLFETMEILGKKEVIRRLKINI